MTTRRVASTPPSIDGFTPVRLIGAGGYAEVFLYRQHRPAREVAVKVMLPDAIDDHQRDRFTAEADSMATLSTHPYIVTVFQADIAADGRAYIVMEFYPGSNFLERVREEQLSVAEVLRTGIHIAGAIETAHRAGILHRDLKPANILTSGFGRPGLTDFGIAGAGDHADDPGDDGMSIPWAPPEAFGSDRLTTTADIYSLAATLYHLLAGHSPFEQSGQRNTPLDLMNRIQRSPLPPIGRQDVPPSLERVLAQAMAKNPAHRPRSAAELGRLLQGVEAEMRFSVTQMDLASTGAEARRLVDPATVDEEATRIRGVVTISPEAPPSPPSNPPPNPPTVPPAPASPITSVPAEPTGFAPPPERPRVGLLAEPEISATVTRPVTIAPVADSAPPSGRRTLAIVGGVVAIVLVAVGAFFALRSDSDGEGTVNDTVAPNDGASGESIVIAVAPDPVVGLTGVANADGTFAFTWTALDASGDEVAYQVTENATADRPAEVHAPQPATTFQSAVPCIEVVSIVANLPSPPASACAG